MGKAPAHEKTVKRKDVGPIAHWVGKTVLRLFGWHIEGEPPPERKFIVIAAPHISNWDLFVALFGALAYRRAICFMIKDTVFWWPLSAIWHWLGGIPVNRRERSSVVDQMVKLFNESESLILVMAPEGTRRKAKHWRTGFYWIAHNAGVPIVPGYFSYEKKFIRLGQLMETSGDFEADFARIQAYYQENVGITPQCKPKEDQ